MLSIGRHVKFYAPSQNFDASVKKCDAALSVKNPELLSTSWRKAQRMNKIVLRFCSLQEFADQRTIRFSVFTRVKVSQAKKFPEQRSL